MIVIFVLATQLADSDKLLDVLQYLVLQISFTRHKGRPGKIQGLWQQLFYWAELLSSSVGFRRIRGSLLARQLHLDSFPNNVHRILSSRMYPEKSF